MTRSRSALADRFLRALDDLDPVFLPGRDEAAPARRTRREEPREEPRLLVF